MNNKFLRLHNAEDNSVTLVNVDDISVVDSDTFENRLCSKIYMNNTAGIQEFNVNESPEKIYTMIEEMYK